MREPLCVFVASRSIASGFPGTRTTAPGLPWTVSPTSARRRILTRVASDRVRGPQPLRCRPAPHRCRSRVVGRTRGVRPTLGDARSSDRRRHRPAAAGARGTRDASRSAGRPVDDRARMRAGMRSCQPSARSSPPPVCPGSAVGHRSRGPGWSGIVQGTGFGTRAMGANALLALPGSSRTSRPSQAVPESRSDPASSCCSTQRPEPSALEPWVGRSAPEPTVCVTYCMWDTLVR